MAEPRGDKLTNNEELDTNHKELLNVDFREHLLSNDVGNSLVQASFCYKMGKLEDIQAVQTYEEYVREKADSLSTSNTDAYYDYVMSRSDAAAVQEYNACIRAFNEDIPNIKRNHDIQRVGDFVKKALEILRAKRKQEG